MKTGLDYLLHPKITLLLFWEIRLIKKSGLFNGNYYLSTNQDLIFSHMDLVKHFCLGGWKDGKNPSDKFDTQFFV